MIKRNTIIGKRTGKRVLRFKVDRVEMIFGIESIVMHRYSAKSDCTFGNEQSIVSDFISDGPSARWIILKP